MNRLLRVIDNVLSRIEIEKDPDQVLKLSKAVSYLICITKSGSDLLSQYEQRHTEKREG